MTSAAGMENHLMALLPGLHSRGLDVSLFVLVEPDKLMDAYILQMRRLDIPTEPILIRRDFDPGLLLTLKKRFRQGQYDAVHTHLIHADLHGVLAARQAKVKRIFFSGHNDDRFRSYLPVRLLQRFLWQRVTAGIAISEALREFMIRVESAPPDRVHTIHYGLDPTTVRVDPNARDQLRAELGIPPRMSLLGSVCRLIEQKGLRYSIEAFAQIAGQFPDVHYVIAGDGPLRSSLIQQAEGTGLKERIHFLGWRDNARSLLAGFDVMLMPSLWEGFGLVTLEAMALNVPIIASRVSALPEIIVDGDTGYLVPPADSSALADAITKILRNPIAAQVMGTQGRRRLEAEFSLAKMVDKTLQVYGE